MTDFQAWIPPAGAVVDPPVHPMTDVLCLWSDGSRDEEPYPAKLNNWSSFGDGPRVVAYAVVEEYKPAPKVARERYLCIHHNGNEVMLDRDLDNIADLGWKVGENAFLMREVLEGREVVADGDAMAYLMRIAHIATTLDEARSLARQAIARMPK